MRASSSGIRVTVEDLETGEKESAMVPVDSYIVTTVGRRYVHHEQIFANGTVVLTLKLDQDRAA